MSCWWFKQSIWQLAFVCVLGKPNTYSFIPASRRLNVALNSYSYPSFYIRANPPLILCSNWSFVSASGSTTEYSVASSCLTSAFVSLTFYSSYYGNLSITLTNSNGSRTETFQVLPQGKSHHVYCVFLIRLLLEMLLHSFACFTEALACGGEE